MWKEKFKIETGIDIGHKGEGKNVTLPREERLKALQEIKTLTPLIQG